MARKLILENLMKLASSIGANPNKFMGTRTNITFLGTGPTKNPLFQRPLAGIDQASMKQLGPGMIPAVEDAMGFATAGKLNDIQLKILTENLRGINKVLNPPPLPTASVVPLRAGIMNTERAAMKRMVDAKPGSKEQIDAMTAYTKLNRPSRLPEPGPGDIEAFKLGMTMQTGQSRAIAREILLKDTRLNLPDDVISSLRGKYDLAKGADPKWDPLELMKKYYGSSMRNYDDFLNQVDLSAAGPGEFADMVLKHIKLTPSLTFAGGGLANVLQVNNTVSRYDLM